MVNKATVHTPEVFAIPATDFAKLPALPPEITDKRGYAAHWKLSPRHISNLLAQGLPHFAIGRRRVRINIAEADLWMLQRFATRRLGSTTEGGTAR